MITIGHTAIAPFPLLLAPMEDVSDPPFRAVCKQHGADLMFTEFISAEGLIRDAHKSLQKLDIYDEERPIGIQIFGGEIDSMIQAAEIAEAAGPNLIDINYGCPVKKVTCKGAGAGILLDIDKMVDMTAQIVKRVKLPVTVKTRLGWDENTIRIVEVAERLQDVGIQALSIHARTRAQMYKGEADWSYLAKVKANPRFTIPLFGNGDVDSPQKAKALRDTYGVDGLMIGRASIGYPWIFREVKHHLATGQLLDAPTVHERVEACHQHLQHSIAWKGEVLGVLEMRRHYTNYFKGFADFKQHRLELVNATEAEAIFQKLNQIAELYAEHQPVWA